MVFPGTFKELSAGAGTVAFDIELKNDRGCPMEEGGQRLLVSRVEVCLPIQSSWPGLRKPPAQGLFSKVTYRLPWSICGMIGR